MRQYCLIPALAALLLAAPASAQQAAPVGDRDPNAVDIAKTPVTDLNLEKKEIPDLLVRAQQRPYDLDGLGQCRQLIGAVGELDDLLGPDLDLPQETRDRIAAGRVGKAVVGSFIPFRGIIREVSGANDQERRMRAAIQAGLARRGFLKGVGEVRGCKYPGRPATRANVAGWMAQQQTDDDQARVSQKDEEDKTGYASQAVVQPIN